MSERLDTFIDAIKNIASIEISMDELARACPPEDEEACLKLAEAARDWLGDYIAALDKRREQEL